MSNVILPSTLSSTAKHQSAPMGLRTFQNDARNHNAKNSSNPILKPPSQRHHQQQQQDHEQQNRLDAMMSPMDKKLREFQQELIATEGEQKNRAMQDDDIVERRLHAVEERRSKIQAAIQGERWTGPEACGDAGADGHCEFGDLLMMDDQDGDKIKQQQQQQEGGEATISVPALQQNAYSELRDLRENQRMERKAKKEQEKAAQQEKENQERKRRGALANLAIKMKLHPERYTDLQRKSVEAGVMPDEEGATGVTVVAGGDAVVAVEQQKSDDALIGASVAFSSGSSVKSPEVEIHVKN